MNTMPKKPSPIPSAVLEELKALLGPSGYIDDPAAIEPYCQAWRDNWHGWTPLVARPANTEEVAAVVRLCAKHRVAIVPQGGNTGLTGASQPHDDGSEIILSTTRMNRVRAIDTQNDTMTVEAGCILADLQQAAADAGRLFPLSLAAEGSCQIGGNLSTNAGGTQVLRYGNARNLVLGLEVVLADGQIWNGLRGLRKDNTGYDLKQLFIGAEGTLGIITAAVLKLFPRSSDVQTALIAIPDPAAAVALLERMREAVGDQVTGFELMQRRAVAIAEAHVPAASDPFAQPHPWYVLAELGGQGQPGTLRGPLEEVLGAAMEAGLVEDAVIAETSAQSERLWAIREGIPEAQNHEGASIKHDVSVPVPLIPEFLERADAALEAAYPGIRVVAFGHIGDGNIHYNPAQPVDMPGADFAAQREEVNRIVHDLVVSLNGSISAEHGLGRLRREENKHYKSDVEIALMQKLKQALDPDNILNPGKVV